MWKLRLSTGEGDHDFYPEGMLRGESIDERGRLRLRGLQMPRLRRSILQL